MKYFEHNITYCELKNESTINDLTHVNNFIAASVIFRLIWLILEYNVVFKKLCETQCASLK